MNVLDGSLSFASYERDAPIHHTRVIKVLLSIYGKLNQSINNGTCVLYFCFVLFVGIKMHYFSVSFADITIGVGNVLALNGDGARMSEYFPYQQRWFARIELTTSSLYKIDTFTFEIDKMIQNVFR